MDATTTKHNKSKFSRTLHKVINLRTASKIASNNGICLLASQYKSSKDDLFADTKSKDGKKHNNKAVMEALVAKLFASITAIKAAYAELQMAQHPYNSDAIQAADQAVVDELKAISELKRSFLKKQLDLSPQVTIMLAEIQEQQSLMKTYEIMIKKLETESEAKNSEASALKNKLQERLQVNKSLEKKLNSSGYLTMFDNITLRTLNPSHFIQFLHYTLRSVRHFVKQLIHEMEAAHWDLNAAIKFIEPEATFTNPNHKCFAFESYVAKTMLEGFNIPNFSSTLKTTNTNFFETFKTLLHANPKYYLLQNLNSAFAKFVRSKYFQLVHAKMECSFFGNLSQRKVVNSGVGFPESQFFTAFAEMCRRVWLLHCLAFSFEKEVMVFQVRKGCRFSEVYMECVAEDEFSGAGDEDLRVGFTVVPGFKIGESVVQCQVYLSPGTC